MPRVARPESSSSESRRVIAHIDMDCFYVQVEQRRRPTLRGQPTAVVQYNSWKGGGLIAVGYEARKFGVKRSMRGDEAKKVCPDIQLVQVPVARGKADLTVYRNAGSEVVSILARKGRCERASIDEVYLDLSEAAEAMLAASVCDSLESISEEALKSHVLGLPLDGTNTKDCVREWFLMNDADHRDKLLACGALIVAELRLEVLKETEFTCSAGIAHNKMLAKLASGMNKPAQQTIVPFSAVKEVLEPLPIKKMKQLGGKLGTSLQDDLSVNTVGDLMQFSEEKLQERYGINTGTWLWNIARGICGEQVEDRLLPKSHGSGKTFPGSQALKTVPSVRKWLNDLCEELHERLLCDLEQNKRIARTLTLHGSAYKLNDSESLKKFPSKSCPLRYGVAQIQEDALNLFNAALREFVGVYNVTTTGNKYHHWAVTGLSVSASKIVEIPSGTQSIMKYFNNPDRTCSSIKESNSVTTTQGDEIDSQIDTCENEVRTYHDMQNLNSELDKTDVFKDAVCTTNQDLSSIRVEQQKDGPMVEPSLSSSGAGYGPKLTQSKEDFHVLCLKPEKHKRKFHEEKGTPSILRFFRNQESCSFPGESHVKTSQEIEASPSVSSTDFNANGCLDLEEGKLLEANEHRKNGVASTRTSNLGQDGLGNNAWSYKSDEIDPVVLNELPREIQAEVRAWLQPQKRGANTAKRGSSIVNYFSPTANS